MILSKHIPNIIDFAENNLEIQLYPWQKLILKIFYLKDEFNKRLIIHPDEINMIKNDIKNPKVKHQILDKIGMGFKSLHVVTGRRAGKDLLSCILMHYEFNKFIQLNELGLVLVPAIGFHVFDQTECAHSLLAQKLSMFANKLKYSHHLKSNLLEINNFIYCQTFGTVSGNNCSRADYSKLALINEILYFNSKEHLQSIDYIINYSNKSAVFYTPNQSLNLENMFYKNLYDERCLTFQLPSYILNRSINLLEIEKEKEYCLKMNSMKSYNMNIEAEF